MTIKLNSTKEHKKIHAVYEGYLKYIAKLEKGNIR